MKGLHQAHTYRCVCGDSYDVPPIAVGRLVFCPRCRKRVIVPLCDGGWAKELGIDLEKLARSYCPPVGFRAQTKYAVIQRFNLFHILSQL